MGYSAWKLNLFPARCLIFVVRVAVSPRTEVGPGFDSQGSVNFFFAILLSQFTLDPCQSSRGRRLRVCACPPPYNANVSNIGYPTWKLKFLSRMVFHIKTSQMEIQVQIYHNSDILLENFLTPTDPHFFTPFLNTIDVYSYICICVFVFIFLFLYLYLYIVCI